VLCHDGTHGRHGWEKHSVSALTSYSSDKIQNISRVVVELGNPMSKTTAGRVMLADNLLQKGFLKTPQEYVTTMNTGNLESATEGPESQLATIHKENEMLMQGQPAKAIVGDPHLLHTQEHLIVVNDPELRARAAKNDPEQARSFQTHSATSWSTSN
jgi:hypothetical protein